MENNYMDKLVRDSLGDYEMNFPASDWDEMEQRLDRSDSMRRKLYLTKGIEVCLMVFAIWTAVHWVQSDINTTDVSAQRSIEEQLQQPNTPMITPILSTEEATASEKENSDAIIEEATDNKVSYENMPIAQTEKRATSLETVKAVLEEIPTIFNNQSNDLPIESELYINKKSVLDKAVIENVINTTKQTKVFAANNSTFIPSIKTELLETSLKELKALELSVNPENILGESKEEGLKKDRKFRLGIIASMDWFNIRTPDVVAVTKESSAMSTSGGFSFDIKLSKKLRLESGILVSKRTHTESSISQGFNDPNVSLTTNAQAFIGERIDLKTTSIEVPLNVKYELVKKKKTSVYGLAGVSNHLVMSIQNTLFEKNITTQNNYDVTIQTAGRGNVSESGLADQGQFNKNHFISLNAGLGIEHQLNDRLSIFAQTSYKHGVGGIGRHDDQISSVSVATGMRGAL